VTQGTASIITSISASVLLLAVLLLFLFAGSAHSQATPPAAPRTGEANVTARPWKPQTYTPVVTITLPVANDLLTTTHLPVQQIQIEYHCGDLCVGSAALDVVSATVDGGVTYHEAISDTASGRYVYSWTLPTEDLVTYVLIAQARNGWGNVGASEPVTVHVDTVAPTTTAPLDTGTWSPTSTLVFTWPPSSDGAGIAGYTVNITGSDSFTHTAFTRAELYTITAASGVTDGVTYYARLRASDGSGNRGAYGPASDGITPDMSPPTSTVTAAPVWHGLTPIQLTWHSRDTQSGVANTHLYYRRVPTDTEWRDSGLEQPGCSGTFHFTPGGYLTYTFAVQAGDNLGNVSDLPVTGTQVVVKPVYIYLPLTARNLTSPWRQAGGTDGIDFYDIAVCPSDPLLQYAGTTSNGLYRSTDGGITWQHWALDGRVTPVVVNHLDCAETFVADWWNGVYRVTGQDQATSINQGLAPYIYGLALSGDGQTLYAGSSTNGVYRTDTDTVNWTPINDGISDLRIRSLYLINGTLYAGGRQCTYYYSDDGGDSWQTETILDGGQSGDCGDAQVWAIAEMNDALYAGLGLDKGLYRRSTGGSWNRISDAPAATIFRFALHPYLSHLYAGAYGHGVYICEPDGHCQPLPKRDLGTPNVRSLTVAETPDARLLAGSDDGIWWVPLTP